MSSKKIAKVELTRRDKFAHNYVLNGQNGTQAYLNAGYKCKIESAWVGAHRLLRDIKVRERVAQLQNEYHDKLTHTREQTIQEIDNLGHFDPIDMFDDDGKMLPLQMMPAIARKMVNKIEMSLDKDENLASILKVEYGKDKRGYLDMAAKFHNLYDSHQNAGNGVIKVMMYCPQDANL